MNVKIFSKKNSKGCVGIITLFLVSCTSYYTQYKGNIGYSDLWLEKDKVEVTYIGPEQFNETQAKKYALIRAAQNLYDRGFDYFVVLSTQINKKKDVEQYNKNTRITEYGTATDGKDISIDEYPGYSKVITQPSITILCQGVNQQETDALSTKDMLEQGIADKIIKRKDIVRDRL